MRLLLALLFFPVLVQAQQVTDSVHIYTQTGGIIIKGRVTTAGNAGNLTVQHTKITSGTSTIFIGSFLKVTRIN